MLASPQGEARQSNTLPDTFHPTQTFFDSNEVFGVKFHRQIPATAWAVRHGFAGRSITDIQLQELAFRGWEKNNLRCLSAGRYASILFARSIREAVFASSLLSKLREGKVDLDQVAAQFFQDTQKSLPSDLDENQKRHIDSTSWLTTLFGRLSHISVRSWKLLKIKSVCFRKNGRKLANARLCPLSALKAPKPKRPLRQRGRARILQVLLKRGAEVTAAAESEVVEVPFCQAEASSLPQLTCLPRRVLGCWSRMLQEEFLLPRSTVGSPS